MSESIGMELEKVDQAKSFTKVPTEKLKGWLEQALKLETDQPTRQRADDITYQWSDGSVCFHCPCGEKDIVTDAADDPHVCSCGRIYRVSHFVTVEVKA